MTEPRPELRIQLPRDPVLRVLVYYGVGALILLTAIRIGVTALSLPRWIAPLAVSIAVVGAPLVAFGAWVGWRRR